MSGATAADGGDGDGVAVVDSMEVRMEPRLNMMESKERKVVRRFVDGDEKMLGARQFR